MDKLEAAIFAESLATHNGFRTLLELLVAKKVLGREDIVDLAQSMNKAFELDEISGNIFVEQIQRSTEEFLAALIARSQQGE
jgi:hypothetical protein